jgi:Ca2+-binding EF-hand superfamily protein
MPPKKGGKAVPKQAPKAKAKPSSAPAPSEKFDVDAVLKLLNPAEVEYLNSDEFKAKAADTFDRADKDRSGVLNDAELADSVLRVVSPHRRENLDISEDKAKELLLKFDTDKNGVIDKDEFFRFVQWVVAKQINDYFGGDTSKEAGEKDLEHVMTNLFRCFDYDEDGFVEKMEFLDGIERIKGYIEGSKTQLELKERKAGVAWFNACEGVEKEGRDSYMPPKVFHAYVPQYLCDLFLKTSTFLDEQIRTFDPNVSPGKLAEFIQYRFADSWLQERFPKEFAAPAAEVKVDAQGKPVPPTYPIKVPFTGLKRALEDAKKFGLPAVVVHGDDPDNEACETYFKYQNFAVVDCKGAIGEVSVRKTKTKAEWKAEVHKSLQVALTGTTPGKTLPKPIWFRFNTGVWPLVEYLGDDGLPPELFTSEFTPEVAKKCGYYDDIQKSYVENNDYWPLFSVVITSSLKLELAMEVLPAAIPNFKDCAIIETYYE